MTILNTKFGTKEVCFRCLFWTQKLVQGRFALDVYSEHKSWSKGGSDVLFIHVKLKGNFTIFYMLSKYVPGDIKYIFTKFYRHITTNNAANRKFVILKVGPEEVCFRCLFWTQKLVQRRFALDVYSEHKSWSKGGLL
jgi:hypothetical protein